jgi:hypothetical protein
MLARTNAPARLTPGTVRADDPALFDEPFVYWSGAADLGALTGSEISGLRKFFALGGILLADDASPVTAGAEAREPGPFGRAARRELARVLPDGAPVDLGADHVIFHSFYLLQRAVGRWQGRSTLEGIVRGGQAQAIFSDVDLGGGLEGRGEYAIRLAVNIAMYVLCSNYKDDQVHVRELMHRRARPEP